MCFSTTATYAAGTLPAVIDFARISKIEDIAHLMLVGIPLLFAMQ